MVTKNGKLDDINEMVDSSIPDEIRTHRSADSVMNDDFQFYVSATFGMPTNFQIK